MCRWKPKGLLSNLFSFIATFPSQSSFKLLHNWKKPADRNQLKLFLGFDLSPDKLRVSEGVIEWKVREDGAELSQSHFMIAALVMNLVVTVLQSKVLNSVNREKNLASGKCSPGCHHRGSEMMLIQRHHTTLYSPRMLSSGDSYLKQAFSDGCHGFPTILYPSE